MRSHVRGNFFRITFLMMCVKDYFCSSLITYGVLITYVNEFLTVLMDEKKIFFFSKVVSVTQSVLMDEKSMTYTSFCERPQFCAGVREGIFFYD